MKHFYLLTAANKPSRRGMESMKVFIIPPINEERASRGCDISGSATTLLIRVKSLGCGFRAFNLSRQSYYKFCAFNREKCTNAVYSESRPSCCREPLLGGVQHF